MTARPLNVADVMSTNVLTVDPNDPLLTVDGLNENRRIRHLPVVDEDGVLVGIVTQRDIFHSGLLKALGYGTAGRERLLDDLLVKEVMSGSVVTTTPDTLLFEAAATMLERQVGCLPVLQGDELVGILTEGDFVKLARDGLEPPK